MFRLSSRKLQRATFRSARIGSLLWIVSSAAAWAGAVSPMRFESFGLDAGLSELAVNAIGQDSSGFLWVGTEDGLDRYDGYRFVHFTHDGAVPGSVPDNFIADLCIDAAGSLWIAT